MYKTRWHAKEIDYCVAGNQRTNFRPLGVIKAAGNSSTLLAYAFTDKFAPAGTVYYRLKQTDTDGTFTYAAIIDVTTKAIVFNLNVYPNSTAAPNILNIYLQGTAKRQYVLEVIDVYGRQLHKQTIEMEGNNISLIIPASVTDKLKDMCIIRCTDASNGKVLVAKILVR
ncbi:MAG: hypothetical protein JWQ14_1957 [Adhaeribacter sp.]|nr:hypothetical protein [Adhaeribacter sp.]